MGLVPSLKFHISAPANQKNWEDDPFLFEILPIFQRRFAVSFRACSTRLTYQTCSNGLGLSMVACNATICLPILGAWVCTENSHPQSETDGPIHQLINSLKTEKNHNKSLKSKLQWPHRRRSLAWLSSMRLGHHQWCRIQNSLQPQGPPDKKTGDSVPWWCGVFIPQKNGFHGCVHPSQKNPPKVGSWHRSVKLSVRIHLETRKPKRVHKEKSPQDFGAMTIYLWCIMILRNCHFIEKKICYQHTSLSCEWKLGTTVGKTVAAPLWDVWSQWSPAGAHAVSSAPLNAVQLARDPTM